MVPIDPIGAASFALQLFDGCVKGGHDTSLVAGVTKVRADYLRHARPTGYNLLIDVVQMPESCAKKRLNLFIEYNLFLSWGQEVGLIQETSQQGISKKLGTSGFEISAILSEIHTLLDTIAEQCGRYEELRPEDVSLEQDIDQGADIIDRITQASAIVLTHNEENEAEKKPKSLGRLARRIKSDISNVLKNPKRIQWVLIDADRFDTALARLHELTSHLWRLVGEYRLKTIQDRTEKIFMELVQSRESQKELAALVEAVVLLLSHRDPSAHGEVVTRNELQTLHDLAKLKELNMGEFEELENTSEVAGDLIKSDEIKYAPEQSFLTITKATYQDPADASHSKMVWIQWKQYGRQNLQDRLLKDEGQGSKVRGDLSQRTTKLARLLHNSKPADFCTPHCLGCFDEENNCRFGWIFAMPSNATDRTTTSTLRLLLLTMSSPSLTDRVALASKLATCLLYFHAVNWLHKDLRSENILFFHNIAEIPDIRKPVVAGFGLSRPDAAETLEKAEASPERDIYRWPSSQTALPDENRSRKTFDIYSLGIILLEIAHWKPIEKIMGFANLGSITTSESGKIRSRLLETEPAQLDEILQMVGKKYHNAVKACIAGPAGFNLDDKDNQTEPVVAVKLQRQYIKLVVQELQALHI